MRYEFEGLIHGGAYFRHFTVYWGTTEMQTKIALETPGAQPLVHFRKGKRDIKKRFYRYKRNRRQIKDYDRQLFRSLRACKLAAVLALKMAAKRACMVVDYNQLNSFSSVVLNDIAYTSTRKTYKNKFNVERIIYRRKTRNVSIEVNTWCHLHVEACYKSVFISSLQRILSILLEIFHITPTPYANEPQL